MSSVKLTEKFIGFVDILGYSSLTRAAEEGRGLTFQDLEEMQAILGTDKMRKHYEQYGPTICPAAPRVRKDMDFQLTQVWDSVVVSTEVSPAGIINLVSHCFNACIMLLTKGVMCRGYIKKGMILHDGLRVLGSGHVDTVASEKNVSIFKRHAEELGTPFIEVDPEVVEYVTTQTDKCVKEMFSRHTLTHDGLTAIFPIKRLSHSFIIAGFGMPAFEPNKEKESNNNVRQSLIKLKQKVLSHIEASVASAVRKSEHYIRALDEQLKTCDRTDEMIDSLQRPLGRPHYMQRC